MNTYYVSDENFFKSDLYQNYLKDNPTTGRLKIRAYAANQAVPISGMNIIIYKIIDENKVIFYEGNTNESGVIEKINLPTPVLNSNDTIVPNKATYLLNASYTKDNINLNYEINMYENICVVQNINVVPNMGDLIGY